MVCVAGSFICTNQAISEPGKRDRCPKVHRCIPFKMKRYLKYAMYYLKNLNQTLVHALI